MPTYEYECAGCKRAFETEQRISEPALQTCPLPSPLTDEDQLNDLGVVPCGGAVRRLISGSTVFVLKGSGWFRDGY